MTDPVNSPSQPVNNQQVLSPLQQESDAAINSGYDTQDSTSYVDTSNDISPQEDISELPQNNNSQLNSQSYLSASLLNRVDSFRSTLSEFNTSFFNQYKDNTLALLEGGSTLIMFLSGSLHGFKIMGALNTVLSDSSAKEMKLNKEKDKLEIKEKIQNLDEVITNLNLEKGQKTQQLNQLYDQIQNKNIELNSLKNQTNNIPVDPKTIEALEQEISNLSSQSNDFILFINDTNQQLQQNITTKDNALNQQKFLTYLISSIEESTTNIANILKGTGVMVTNYLDRIAEKLEKNTDKIAEENIESTERLDSKHKDILQEKLVTEKLQTDTTNNTEINSTKNLLNTNFLRKLLTVFSPRSAPSMYGTEHNNPLSENIQQPVALVLSADINDKKFPDLAHKQPYFGDSISLDGADNPVAYSMILLMHNMELLEHSITTTNKLQTAEEKEQALIQQVLDLQNDTDLLVFNSLNQADAPDFQRRIQA